MSREKSAKAGQFRNLHNRLAREQGTIVKDWGGRLPVALAYPNSYHLGMSNLGIHAIYGLLNSYRQVVCERVFLGEDKQAPPLSVESRRPLPDFAVVAFSVSYELDYFNVVKILRGSGIPLYAAERGEQDPLVIAGGPCITANPMPLSPLFDCLCVGEAEAILPSMLPILHENIGGSRDMLLEKLAQLPGIYAPLHPSGNPVARQWVKNLDDFPTASVVLTPDTELGDLYLIEVERGCGWGCRFCLVHETFSPMRFRSTDRLIEQAREGLQYRKRIGLVGPAVSSHPGIEEITSRLLSMGAGLSTSSLRISPLSPNLLRGLAQGNTRTITMAPEAGSPRLRRLIKKEFPDEEVLEAIAMAAGRGIKQVKLYFMLGLPSETDEDAEAIINLVLNAKGRLDRMKSSTRLALNVAPFVPKAGTPFQWLPMASLPTLNRRLTRLKNKLPARGIKLKSESPAWSQVQAVLARGDASLAEVLADMEEVTLSGWRKAIEKHRIDVGFYAHQRWDISQKLPWTVVDLGSKLKKLERELREALF